MGVDAQGFPGGLLRLDPAFAYVSLLPHDLCHGWSASRWPPAGGGKLFISISPLRNDSPVTVNNVVILFVVICSFTVIPYQSDRSTWMFHSLQLVYRFFLSRV